LALSLKGFHGYDGVTIGEAAAPHSSLAFMFWRAGLFVFPLMLLYTVVSYSVFRGKVGSRAEHY
jgi:cytochrome d ubiquinol oxidase subunit II